MDNHAMKPIKNSRDCMPRKISGAEFNQKLRITSSNIVNTQCFLTKGVIDFSLPGFDIPEGYRLVKSLRKQQYRLIANGEKPETIYLVELKFRQDIVMGKTTCTQIKVWRSTVHQYIEIIKELPRKFFVYLLNSYCIMVTNEEQTDAGQRFWETMISRAFDKKYYVYASNSEEEDRPLSLIKDMDDFYLNWVDLYWGKDIEFHTHRLVVISKMPLISAE
ncbi:hypothetical protein [Providencia rettgeri]|uniref:Uncharacterized protein n=1 Tax=Providencia rettgeri TaxID=587 RepID=A0AAW6U8Q4_PRORE|nr:hypothetical protein [Providencia rettgeri]MDI9091568.1 hypothetical protein [Providencia rettgeri]MDT2037411.1 hypothetical protein [Providencia rettgeri]